jgi:flagellar biosynthesis protein FlhA
MADVGVPLSLTGPNRPDAKMVWGWVARGEVAMALGIVGIIVLLIVPAPAILLDLLLATSITAAVLILMTSVLIRKPLEFSAFPTVLLVTTLYRLGLNIASARLILSHGHEGTEAAGHVIQAFGQLMMGGDFVIGVIVFAILVVVNFVVITKGSTRIAEVAARFTLDSMPGKQMAIDADLSTGLIDEAEAKRRRKELEQESTFFGAMDGASKFVRGDAVAGLIITAINIVGGIIIGVAQHHVPLAQAFSTYTIMTIGDGLVTQVPALVISIAAGFLVSKAGVEGSADKALVNQLAMNPISLGMVSAASGVIAFVPGMPIVPFAAIAAGAGALAWRRAQDAKKAEEEAKKPPSVAAGPAAEGVDEEPISAALAIDDVKIELGYGLLSLINDLEGRRLTDQIRALRRTLAADFGFVMPPVRILDNMRLANQGYAIRIKEMESGAGEVRLGMLLAMDPRGLEVAIPGEHVREPAFGLPATWIDEGLREEATFRGYTIVDPATVLTTHLTEILKDNMADLLSYAEVQKLLKELPAEQKKLVDELVPSVVSVTTIQRVLQALLRERVSIRDLPQILEGIAEAAGSSPTVSQIVEHVRSRLARQLCFANKGDDGALAIVTLSPDWEAAFADALIGQGGEEKQLAMAPSRLQEFIRSVRDNFERAGQAGDMPVLLTGPVIRPYVRSIVERFRPQTVVMSQNEIHPKARLKTVGVV